MLGWQELRGVGRQEQQVDMRGYTAPRTVMPAGPVEQEHDLLVGTRADLVGERLEFHREERDVHGRRQMPHGAPRGGMHKADERAPGIPMLDWGERALAGRGR